MTVFSTDLVMVRAVFNISIFSVYFLYMLLHILLLFGTERAGVLERWSFSRQSALQSARPGRRIRDVTVSIDYRV